MVVGSDFGIASLAKPGAPSEDDARDVLEQAGIIVNNKVLALNGIIIAKVEPAVITEAARVQGVSPDDVLRVVGRDGVEYALALREPIKASTTIEELKEVEGEVHGRVLLLQSSLLLALCGDMEARHVTQAGVLIARFRKTEDEGDKVHACVYDPVGGYWREDDVDVSSINNMVSVLKIPEELARKIQEVYTSVVNTMIVRAKYFDTTSREGYITIVIGGREARLNVYNPRRKEYIIEYNGRYASLSELEWLLPPEARRYARDIRHLIKSMILEYTVHNPREVCIRQGSFTTASRKPLEVCITTTGKIRIRYGPIRRNTNITEVLNILDEVLNPSDRTPELYHQVREFIEGVGTQIASIDGFMISKESNLVNVEFNTEVVGDRMVMFVPFYGEYSTEEEKKAGVLALRLVMRPDGSLEEYKVHEADEVIQFQLGDKIVYKDYFKHFANPDALKDFLPGPKLVLALLNDLRGGRTVSFMEAYDEVSRYLDKYVYLTGVNRMLAILYTIAQAFYDLLTYFPLLIVYGEQGSGKRQLAIAVIKAMPLAIRVSGRSTEPSLMRLIGVLHPSVAVDEAEKLLEQWPEFWNSSYERDLPALRTRHDAETDKYVVDVINFYGPKVVPVKPGKASLRPDELSRAVEIWIMRVRNRVFPQDVDEGDRLRINTLLLLLKARHWRDFLDAYELLRGKLIGIDQRTKDTYLPLVTIAYLIAKETGNTSILREVLTELANVTRRRSGIERIQEVVVTGILKSVVNTTVLEGNSDYRRFVEVTARDVVENAKDEVGLSDREVEGMVMSVARFLGQAPFVSDVRKDRTKSNVYIINIENLYKYVDEYGITIRLSEEDMNKLREATGLDWEVGFNPSDWVDKVISDLFPQAKPEAKPSEAKPAESKPGAKPEGKPEKKPEAKKSCEELCSEKYPVLTQTTQVLYNQCLEECRAGKPAQVVPSGGGGAPSTPTPNGVQQGETGKASTPTPQPPTPGGELRREAGSGGVSTPTPAPGEQGQQEEKPQGGEEEFDPNRHVRFTREEVIRRARERAARKRGGQQQQGSS